MPVWDVLKRILRQQIIVEVLNGVGLGGLFQSGPFICNMVLQTTLQPLASLADMSSVVLRCISGMQVSFLAIFPGLEGFAQG